MKRLIGLLLIIGNVLYAQEWQAVPLVSQAIKDNGHFGGEGCQVILDIEIDAQDGSFLLMGTDVGGIYRSTNGGTLWEPCNVGYNPRGNCGFAIDPNNNTRALAVGGNSMEYHVHGLYLTTDQAATWEYVYPEGAYDGYRSQKDKVAFDPASYDSENDYSSLAYWSNPAGGLLKSTDGGQVWESISTSYGDAIIKVSPDNGVLYIGTDDGFFRSEDAGTTINEKFSTGIRDIAVAKSEPAKVWLITANELYVSDDYGMSFTEVASSSLPTNLATLAVSPVNPAKMVIDRSEGQWEHPVYSSQDGGSTWTISTRDNSNSFMPTNGRSQEFTWHPVDENKVWALGGDHITSSSNAGQEFAWDNNGNTGILVGGFFNFNLADPSLLYLASQDYNGAVSFDDGDTWKYCNASGQGWGGFTYGAYAASADVLVTQVSEAWHTPGKLTVSKDGGNSFTQTSNICNGHETACGDPKDPNVIYFSNWRSTDLGESWEEMENCDGVFVANLYGDKEVFGGKGTDLVKSADLGETWEVVVSLPFNVSDVAYDHLLDKYYIVGGRDHLFQYVDGELLEISNYLPVDQYGNLSVKSVAVDPVDPRVVYTAGSRDVYATDASVLRSRDAGFSWEIITRNSRTDNGEFGKDGAREAFAVRVNPDTRELWAVGGCYGVWKMAAPAVVPFSFPVARMNRIALTMNVDDTFQLSVRSTLPGDTTLTWRSSNTEVATVDTTGLVTAHKKGSSIISAIVTESGEILNCQVIVAEAKGPFQGNIAAIPGTVQAEDFDEGGEGVSYHDVNISNEGAAYRPDESVDIESCSAGGFNVGWIEEYEWLKYTVEIDSTAVYDIDVSAASGCCGGGSFFLEFSEGNVRTDDVSFDETGGWQNWQTITISNVALNKGLQEMKINFLKSGMNLDYFSFVYPEPELVEKEMLDETLTIYPNPYKGGLLQVQYPADFGDAVQIRILSLQGSLIYEKKLVRKQHIDLSDAGISPGLYFIELSNGSRSVSEKLIVM